MMMTKEKVGNLSRSCSHDVYALLPMQIRANQKALSVCEVVIIRFPSVLSSEIESSGNTSIFVLLGWLLNNLK